MECNSCGATLAPDSTTCPKSGSPTPYSDSVSGTYDSTMIASSADPPHQALPSVMPMDPLTASAEPSQVGTQYSSRGQSQYKSQGQSPTGMPNASRSGMSSPTRTIGSVPMLLFIALTCLMILAACGSTQGHPTSGSTQAHPRPGTIILFSIPTAVSQPWGIVMATDGNLWFTNMVENKVGRITTSGKITEFPIPTANGSPVGITSGPDGNLWFTESDGNKIGMITTK